VRYDGPGTPVQITGDDILATLALDGADLPVGAIIEWRFMLQVTAADAEPTWFGPAVAILSADISFGDEGYTFVSLADGSQSEYSSAVGAVWVGQGRAYVLATNTPVVCIERTLNGADFYALTQSAGNTGASGNLAIATQFRLSAFGFGGDAVTLRPLEFAYRIIAPQ
jgi:hypothetical protein